VGESKVRVRLLKADYLAKADEYNETAPPGARVTWAGKKVLEFVVGSIAVGKCFPSYDLIAYHVRCCPDTVRIAVHNCARAGLLSWTVSWHWNVDVQRVTQFPNTYRLGDGVPGPIPGRRKLQDTEIPEAPQPTSKKEESGASQVDVGNNRANAMRGVLKRDCSSKTREILTKSLNPKTWEGIASPQLAAMLATSRTLSPD
jgi:hypothetical protein